MTDEHSAPKRRRRVTLAMALVAVVAMFSALLDIFPPEPDAVAADPNSRIFYENSGWHISPNPEDNHGDHFALLVGKQLRPHVLHIKVPKREPFDGLTTTWVKFYDLSREVTISGPPGAAINTEGGTIHVRCETSTNWFCPAPDGYSVTVQWSVTAERRDCAEDLTRPYGTICPRTTFTGAATRTYIENPNTTTTTTTLAEGPTAEFSWALSETTPRLVNFTNTSTTVEERPLSYQWTFEDGATSTLENPEHVFSKAGTFPVTLVVTDSQDQTDAYTTEVVIPTSLVVNSIGDASATDVEVSGCDTGATVEGEPECTLRAAIETANAEGGGEITFNITGGGVPKITPGTALPDLTSPITVNGTTQPGGFVSLDGGSLAHGLRLAGASSTVKGLVFQGDRNGITIDGGSDHVVEGNRFGWHPGTKTITSMGFAVGAIDATNTRIANNIIHCTGGDCLQVIGGSGWQIADNNFGVNDTGVGLTGTNFGVLAINANAQIVNNVFNTSSRAITLIGKDSGGSSIDSNLIGVSRQGQLLFSAKEAIRVDAAPGVTVTNNVVNSNVGPAIAVTGSPQSELDNGNIYGLSPDDEVPGPVTGGGTVITNNRIGVRSDGNTRFSGQSVDGIFVWAGASNVRIDGNIIGNQQRSGVVIRGGSGHQVLGNSIGTNASGSENFQSPFGIRIEDATNVNIGSAGQPNVVHAKEAAVNLAGNTSGSKVAGNELVTTNIGIGTEASVDDGDEGNPSGAASTSNLTIDGNTVEVAMSSGSNEVDGDSVAISLMGPTTGAVVENNTTTGGDTGVIIGEESEGTKVATNTILGAKRGILNTGAGTTIDSNRIGISRSGTVNGSPLAGLALDADATVNNNVIVGSGNFGIIVGSDAIGQLKGNRIYNTTGIPIKTGSGPQAPRITAAIRAYSGDTDRTVLVVTDLPADGGTVEVFANDSCADPEAHYALWVTAPVKAGRDYVVIPLVDRGDRDAFTVTYTHPVKGTSALSNCEARSVYPDSDGDGTFDPIEDLVGTAGDPQSAVVVTDSGDLFLLAASDGRLRNVAAVDDPAPGQHPGDFTLPHGAVGFEVRDLEPGASTEVAMLTLDGQSPILGDSYWKYGPSNPGAAPSWYRFDFDEVAGTGATLETRDVPGVGYSRVWNLNLTDGARGDSDGAANGTITDPGGPGITVSAPPPPSPPSTVVDDPLVPPTVPDDPAADPDNSGDSDDSVAPDNGAIEVADKSAENDPGAKGTESTTQVDRLPVTGSNTGLLLALGVSLIIAGLASAAITRRWYRLGS